MLGHKKIFFFKYWVFNHIKHYFWPKKFETTDQLKGEEKTAKVTNTRSLNNMILNQPTGYWKKSKGNVKKKEKNWRHIKIEINSQESMRPK